MKVAELQLNSRLNPIQNQPIRPQKVVQDSIGNEAVKSFSQVLQTELEQGNEVKFSAHAMRRIEERQVQMSTMDFSRLQEGFKQLDAKGSVNSVIMMDDTAFVVSVKNKTVVTAMDKSAQTGNVFTNIDSIAIV